ncbi:MAG: YdeI/OmpD-associated family protein [Fimbriimonadaceae bacterium]|nr:YdeI/OmpD-associated family protein [Chitinophagales bacterium]
MKINLKIPKSYKGFPVIYAKDRKVLRNWFMKYHQKEKAVWVVRYKKEKNIPCVNYEEIVEEALCFGFIDSKPNILDSGLSVLYIAQRKTKSVWSNSNKIRVVRLIEEKQMMPAGFEKIEIAKANGSWDAITSSENYEMPAGLKKALLKNKPAKKYFEAFPPGVKKQLYQWIISAKTETTQSKRIHETVSLAEKNIRANQYVKK